MSPNTAALLYLVSGILFILALRGLSSPATSRQGNLFGMAGMAIAIVAPAQTWGLSREEKLEFARQRSIPVPDSQATPYSIDTNLWGRAIAAGVLEDAWVEPPEEIYTLTRSPQDCPDEPAYVELAFESGIPARANGVEMAAHEVAGALETARSYAMANNTYTWVGFFEEDASSGSTNPAIAE